nr:hypothetical protein [Tanacetum cinerariifolium]
MKVVVAVMEAAAVMAPAVVLVVLQVAVAAAAAMVAAVGDVGGSVRTEVVRCRRKSGGWTTVEVEGQRGLVLHAGGFYRSGYEEHFLGLPEKFSPEKSSAAAAGRRCHSAAEFIPSSGFSTKALQNGVYQELPLGEK